jgi:hypothetical protein
VVETALRDYHAAGFVALVTRGTSVSMLVEDMSRNNIYYSENTIR